MRTSQQGVAVVLALGVVALAAIAAAAMLASQSTWARHAELSAEHAQAQALTQAGVDSGDLVSRVDEAAPVRPGPRPPATAESQALTTVLARAAALAAERNRASIRNEHLLLAIAAEDGVGATVLTAVGATPQRIREILDGMNG